MIKLSFFIYILLCLFDEIKNDKVKIIIIKIYIVEN